MYCFWSKRCEMRQILISNSSMLFQGPTLTNLHLVRVLHVINNVLYQLNGKNMIQRYFVDELSVE